MLMNQVFAIILMIGIFLFLLKFGNDAYIFYRIVTQL